jgi:hypothetical protein
MTKNLLAALGLTALLTVGLGPLLAQEPAPTQDDLTLRPGDTITWAPSPPHRVRFGGTVSHNGNLALTPFADVQKVLNISPALVADAQGVALGDTGATVTATVKSDAATSGVSEFFFTCGFPPHTGMMVTVPFKVAPPIAGQPPRNVQIVSANPPRWVLKTAQGDKKLTRP